jgi:putative peptidoglycan lipid II flippase
MSSSGGAARYPEEEALSNHGAGRLAGDAGVVGAATLASRVLGLVRDSVLAGSLSPTATDAFFTAFMIPNLLRRLVGEGALTLAFVPLFTGALRESRARARELLSRVWTLGWLGGLALTLLGIALADPLVHAFAPGFSLVPGKHALTVDLLRWCFPYILFMILLSIAMGALNASGHFFRPAIAPTLLNVCMIAGTLGGAAWLDVPVEAVAWSVFVAGPLQVWLQRAPLRRAGLAPQLIAPDRDPALRRLGALMLPAVLGASVYQFNLLANRFLASLEGEGAVSYLSYADRLLELPLGVFVLALGTASLPSFAAAVKRGDPAGVRASFAATLGLAMSLSLPSAVGLIALREPIVVGLFRWNPELFGPDAVQGVSTALLCYALGLVPITVSRMFVNLCVAHENTRTGARAAVVSLTVNVLASLALVGPLPGEALPRWLDPAIALQHRLVLFDLGYAGLALASSIAAAANAAYVATSAHARHGPVLPSRAWLGWLRTLVASAVLGAVGLALAHVVRFPEVASARALAVLAIYVGGAAVAYVAVLALLGAPETRLLLALLGARFRSR